MRNVMVLQAALEIVEARLKEPMSADDLARACYLSCSGLQKLFGYAFRCSVSDYVTKRRLSAAARDLLNTKLRVIDIALDYQYGSSEAFSRAFKRFFNVSPTVFRRTRRFPELHPKFRLTEDGGNTMMRKPVDISNLYEELKKYGGTYVLSIDLQHFMQVNDTYGYAVGDAVIAEAFARLERATEADMMLFRIGGDEFAIVTGYDSGADAEALARKITAQNGDEVVCGEHRIPLSMRVGISLTPKGSLSYQRALNIMMDAVMKAREENSAVAML